LAAHLDEQLGPIGDDVKGLVPLWISAPALVGESPLLVFGKVKPKLDKGILFAKEFFAGKIAGLHKGNLDLVGHSVIAAGKNMDEVFIFKCPKLIASISS
jgi:hypothetical protein